MKTSSLPCISAIVFLAFAVCRAPLLAGAWKDLAAAATNGEGTFVAVGTGGSILHSPDGASWIAVPSPVTDDLEGIAFAASKFVAVGARGRIITSPDGTTWHPVSSGTSIALKGITSGTPGYVAVGQEGLVLHSPNGTDWTAASVPGAKGDLLAVAYGNGLYIAVGQWGQIATSADGRTWALVPDDPAQKERWYDITGIAFSNGRFITSALHSTSFASSDGTKWTKRTGAMIPGLDFYGAVAFGNEFLVFGDKGIIQASSDGRAWSEAPRRTGARLRGAAASGNLAVFVGDNMAIVLAASQDRQTKWTSCHDAIAGLGKPCDLGGSSAGAAPADPINVLWIVADDMGYGDLSSTGRGNYSTPNIDRIGREGVMMENTYVYPVCTATRTAMLTGHSPQKYGLEGVLLPGYSSGLPANSVTAAKEFKASGYHTGLIGKWHLGDQPASLPNAQGFDDFFGFLWGETGYYTHTKKVAGADALDFHQNRTTCDIRGYTTDLYSSKAISFLRKNQKRPFFLSLCYNAPHYYLEAPAESQDQFDGAPSTKMYAGVMKSLDDSIGRVLDELDHLGLAKNTLVVFTTDNGAPQGEGSNAPFSGYKNSLREGGIRSPLMARLPGTIPQGLRSRENFPIWDLLPTSLGFAGLNAPAGLEGVNHKSLLATPGTSNPAPLCFRYTVNGKISRAVVKGHWKLFSDESTGATSLFDLEVDGAEATDLSASSPAKVAELKSDWNAWSGSFSPDLGTW